jgi:lipopolysaccharide export system protein LptA
MPHHLRTSRLKPAVFVLLAGLCLAGAARAETADKDKPMNIEADALRYDDAKQTSVFTGKVVITKGTIVMRGAKMDVRQDPQGNQFGLLVGSPGAPGFFRQKREGLEEWMEGEADRIEYDSKAQTVVFNGNAVLRRFRGTQLNDESIGNQIVYNSLTEVFSVQGGAPNRSAANPSGRVRAMLTPIPEAPAQPVTPPAGDAAKLRPSTQLIEKNK